MNVQIYGRRDCPETRKAERWFKERKIPFQFIDLKVKGLAPREFETIAAAIGVENLADKGSKRFLEKGLGAMSPSRLRSVLEEDSLLLKTPMVRNGRLATLGYEPGVWTGWK
jgi:arsenate reductase-like glutaredoxin family protein